MMNWDHLLSAVRFGQEHLNLRRHARTEFQRDYDRLIFSPSFRRLQNKTQVFPLPGAVFVHNRLTHSLEVASVGRSLAGGVSLVLQEKYADEPWSEKLQSLDDIVATACLAHDMGNPPFGHSGERAIISYFSEGPGHHFRSELSLQQWADLTHFDGNANAFRLLTHQFLGHREGGFALTYSSLGSIIKYPYASTLATSGPKFGYFQSEEEAFLRLTQGLGLEPLRDEAELELKVDDTPLCQLGTSATGLFPSQPLPRFARHPLCFLVEAADDICYQIMDIEDAHSLKLLSTAETTDLLLGFFDGEEHDRVKRGLKYVTDINEQIGYLRSRAIGLLVRECTDVFLAHEEQILQGTFHRPLLKSVSPTPARAYAHCSEVAVERIYRSPVVVDIEVAGHQIITQLLDKFLEAVLHPDRAYSRLLLDRIPLQYETRAQGVYPRIMAVLDYVSGMTDVYALDLYRKIFGMSLPSL